MRWGDRKKRDDRVHLLRSEGRPDVGARSIGQPPCDARAGGLRPPHRRRHAWTVERPIPSSSGRRPYGRPPTRQQDDPGTHGKLLRAGLLSDNRLQVPALSIRYEDCGSKKQGHRKKPAQFTKSGRLQRILGTRYQNLHRRIPGSAKIHSGS
jgi:hypothetical protein